MKRIIVDTDIGTNPDDAVALAMLANSPEIQIEGVTTVYGDVQVRGNIARKVLAMVGKDVGVYSGIESPLLQNRDVFWNGLEGKDLDFGQIKTKAKEKHAVSFMIETIMNNPGEITLVTLSPLTNLATALTVEPRIADHVKDVIVMGGSTRLGENRFEISPFEHNVNCDPEAASIVFSSPLKMTLIGLDVARQFTIDKKLAEELGESANDLSRMISSMIISHMAYMERDYSYLADVIAAATLIDRSIVETKKMDVSVEISATDRRALTVASLNPGGNIDVCLSVDKQKFKKLLFERAFIS